MRTKQSEMLRKRKWRAENPEHNLELNRKHNRTFRLKDVEAYRKMQRDYKRLVWYPLNKERLLKLRNKKKHEV